MNISERRITIAVDVREFEFLSNFQTKHWTLIALPLLLWLSIFGSLRAQPLQPGITKLWSVPFGGKVLYGSDGSALVKQKDNLWIWVTTSGRIVFMPLDFNLGSAVTSNRTFYGVSKISSEFIVAHSLAPGQNRNAFFQEYESWIYTQSNNGIILAHSLQISGYLFTDNNTISSLSESFIPLYDAFGDPKNPSEILTLYKLNPAAYIQSGTPVLTISSGTQISIQINLSNTNPITIRTSTNLSNWTTLTNILNPMSMQNIKISDTGQSKQFFSVDQK